MQVVMSVSVDFCIFLFFMWRILEYLVSATKLMSSAAAALVVKFDLLGILGLKQRLLRLRVIFFNRIKNNNETMFMRLEHVFLKILLHWSSGEFIHISAIKSLTCMERNSLELESFFWWWSSHTSSPLQIEMNPNHLWIQF